MLDFQTGEQGVSGVRHGRYIVALSMKCANGYWQKNARVLLWGHGGIVVSVLDFRSEGQWFHAQSLSLCCLLR